MSIRRRGSVLALAFIVASAALGAVLTDLSAAAPQNSRGGEPADSLVRLMSAQSAQMMEIDSHKYRKVIGPARFLHNNTYLICDTALWNVDEQVINAVGNVQLLQEETVLTSDRLDYFVDRDVAEFRGVLVQLVDKDQNTLRTRYLDYNTKDSLAIFSHGAAMKDGTGQIIESLDGTYDSKIKVFTFEGEVNMFTDSVFVSSDELIYDADAQTAYFYKGVDAWQDDKMLSADEGVYDRGNEKFSFFSGVHLLSEDQEGWADTLFVYRSTGELSMRHEAQLHDRSRSITGLGDKVDYCDTSSMLTVRERAAIVGEIEESGRIDTVYFGGEVLRYWTVYSSLVSEDARKNAAQRLSDLEVDPVAEYRGKAAKAAADAAAAAQAEADAAMGKKSESELSALSDTTSTGLKPLEAHARRQPVTIHSLIGKLRDWLSSKKEQRSLKKHGVDIPAADSTAAVLPDSLAAVLQDSLAASDSLASADSLASGPDLFADSLAGRRLMDEGDSPSDTLSSSDTTSLDGPSDSLKPQPFDSTKIGFMSAVGSVKVFRKSMQVICDSLLYCDLDSLTRLFKEPVVWNEGNHQYRADSLSIVLQGGHMRKASLMSNAFVIIQEDTATFDQIKGVEMMAYFDTSGTMTRYDVMGDASALFYLQENDAWATANKAESKLLSVDFVGGEIDRVYYYDAPHNDAYPVVQLPPDMHRMKGFSWQPELRPRGPEDITTIALKKSCREEYLSRPRATFKQSDRFFPGYMASVYQHIAYRDSMKVVAKARRDSLAAERRAFLADSVAAARADSLQKADSLATADSLFRADSLLRADSIAIARDNAIRDSLSAAADTLAAADSLSSGDVPARTDPHLERDARKKAAAKAKAAKAAERDRKRKERVEKREARWAELDARDAAKIAAKQEKQLQKKRVRTARELDRLERQQARDREKLERYVERYRKRSGILPPEQAPDSLSIAADAAVEEVFEPDEESVPREINE